MIFQPPVLTIKTESDSGAGTADSDPSSPPSASTPAPATNSAPPPPLPPVTVDIPAAPKLKTDVPNRFWAMVEPYCANITNENLKVGW